MMKETTKKALDNINKTFLNKAFTEKEWKDIAEKNNISYSTLMKYMRFLPDGKFIKKEVVDINKVLNILDEYDNLEGEMYAPYDRPFYTEHTFEDGIFYRNIYKYADKLVGFKI